MGVAGLSSSTRICVTRDRPDVIGAQPAAGSLEAGKVGEGAQHKAASKSAGTGLSAEDLAQIRQLSKRDTEVRQHEQAHLAASGGLAMSGASYTYQKGPDGVTYATSGEVNIDMSSGSTPQETIARARIVQAAALAPAEPSGPDRAVAAQAQQMEQAARSELAQQALNSATQSLNGAKKIGNFYDAHGKVSPAGGQVSVFA